MAIYSNLPVYGTTYQLMLQVAQLGPNMQRDYRYTLAQDLKRRLMDVLVMIYRANKVVEKQPIIAEMRETMVEVNVYLRLLCDLKQLSEKQYLQLAQVSVSIGKQLAAWEKAATKEPAPYKEESGGQPPT